MPNSVFVRLPTSVGFELLLQVESMLLPRSGGGKVNSSRPAISAVIMAKRSGYATLLREFLMDKSSSHDCSFK